MLMVFIELDYILTTQLKRKTLYKLSIYMYIITREEVSSYLFAFAVNNSTLVVSVAVAAVFLKRVNKLLFYKFLFVGLIRIDYIILKLIIFIFITL